MKKLALILTAFIFVGCSVSEDNQRVAETEKINPPEWILGTWVDAELAQSGVQSGFNFKVHDFCVLVVNNSTCYAEQPLTVEESATEDLYRVTLSGQGSSVIYEFRKWGERIVASNNQGVNAIVYTKL